jgi:alpha-beta hydrolase superfamily lysophospholipase
MKLFEEAYSKRGWIVSNPELPVIFMSGEDDPCMISIRKFQKSVRRMIKNGYTSTEDILYHGMRHEILNEVDKVSVWEDILNYIRRITSGSLCRPI